MTNAPGAAAARSAAPSLAPASVAIAQAAHLLLPDLERGRRIDAGIPTGYEVGRELALSVKSEFAETNTWWLSDAGPLQDGGARHRAGVRKPPKKSKRRQ